MSDTQSILYDVPGPRARRRARIGTAVGAVFVLVLAVIAVKRLADNDQFSMEKWGPLIDPSNDAFARVWELLGRALLMTIASATMAIILSLLLGTLLGVARMRLPRLLRIPVVAWIELFRALPVVITIFLVWRLFVDLNIDIGFLPGIDGFWYIVFALMLYNSVIIAEILRSGVASLPRGQGEAARAIGMSEGQVMSSVLLPQAFRTMLPALISQLVVALKDTSLVAVVGAFFIELLKRADLLGQTLNNPLQMFTVVGLIYILLNYGLSKFAEYIERRLSRASTVSGEAVEALAETAAAKG